MSEPNSRGKSVSIVIIDDNPLSLEYLASALARDGINIFTASNPEDGLNLVYEHRPWVVLSDVVMPGASGLDVLERIKNFDPAAEVVLMSAHSDANIVNEAMRKGAVEYLRKPIPLAAIRECVERRLRHHSPRSEAGNIH